jgi:hypothetical protein|tara:strand:+ start:1503 stop:1715 length:213 start_codon:yes stop_codon:yes gene_type:complete
MSEDSSEELAALLAQCESALGQYSRRTGASMFSEVANKPPSQNTMQSKPAEQKRAALLTQRISRLVFRHS